MTSVVCPRCVLDFTQQNASKKLHTTITNVIAGDDINFQGWRMPRGRRNPLSFPWCSFIVSSFGQLVLYSTWSSMITCMSFCVALSV